MIKKKISTDEIVELVGSLMHCVDIAQNGTIDHYEQNTWIEASENLCEWVCDLCNLDIEEICNEYNGEDDYEEDNNETENEENNEEDDDSFDSIVEQMRRLNDIYKI